MFMDRRTYLSRVGGAGTGIAIGSVGAGAVTDGERPAARVPSGDVSPWVWMEPQSVATGEWITHGFSWFVEYGGHDSDQFDSECDQLEHILDITEYEVRLPDRTIGFDESDAYWSDCEDGGLGWPGDDREGYGVTWEYHTPPKPPGEYEFGVSIRYLEEYHVCEPDGCFTVAPGVHELPAATYEVSAGARGR